MAAGLAAAVALGTGSAASAHHSFAAFITTTEKTISGTVKQVDWTNPHTWIWVDVSNGQGTVETFGFEGMSPNYLARRGWSKSTLKPGDTDHRHVPSHERWLERWDVHECEAAHGQSPDHDRSADRSVAWRHETGQRGCGRVARRRRIGVCASTSWQAWRKCRERWK